MHQDDLPPIQESGSALFLAYLLLPVQHHDENEFVAVYTVPIIMSRN